MAGGEYASKPRLHTALTEALRPSIEATEEGPAPTHGRDKLSQSATSSTNLPAPPDAHRSEFHQIGERPAGDRETLEQELVARMQEYVDDQTDSLRTSLYRLEESNIGKANSGEADAETRAYNKVIRGVRELTRQHLPRLAKVLVAGKCDGRILDLYGRRTANFPCNEKGEYPGFYPQDCLAAMAHLEYMRSRGFDYLIFPAPVRWWYDEYPRFERQLRTNYSQIVSELEIGDIFRLKRGVVSSTPSADELAQILQHCRDTSNTTSWTLDWNSGLSFPGQFAETVFDSTDADSGSLPYLNNSIDVVALSSSDPSRLADAKRVARYVVINRSPVGNGESLDLSVHWKTTPPPPAPLEASIVIPVFNEIHHTASCLQSLRETLPADFGGEIIVVDDGSTDETPIRLEEWSCRDSRIAVLRRPNNSGFVDSVNAGAAAARFETLVFLNNDTVLLDGWLQSLVSVLRERPEAGVVGGRLLFPDGTLQEAGGMIFRDGSAAHYGRNSHELNAPMFNWVREIDYSSAALMATPTCLFQQLGGFDQTFAPGYYEDVDYCFRVREAGFRVYLQPECVAVHMEGGTAGTDLNANMKRYQPINEATFAKRWQSELQQHPCRPDRFGTATWLSHSTRGAHSRACP